MAKRYNLDQFATKLGVSRDCVLNWVLLGVLKPNEVTSRKIYFSPIQVEMVKGTIDILEGVFN